LTTGRDELYRYDLIDRPKSMDRGDLDNQKSQIDNLQFAQDRSLDATGNWRTFREDSDGDRPAGPPRRAAYV
jgi:hypothetical protein